MTSSKPQRRIGPYTVLQRIGEGGMGSVYLAEQREPVRRRVALKVLKGGMDSEEFLLRFQAERQALAMMEHSNIAHVLDAGTTEEGRPYLAMEYVKGVPITQYCDDNKLSLAERLLLFRMVCDGVQHAHTKGVIHRDLKPSNVLVTVQDGRPVAKIIDFGLAKATDQRLTEQTLFTEAGQVIGTPEYMSPEQAGVGGLDIDTRTDVYSLGVILYQLLTGQLPITRETLLKHGWLEMLRVIREDEPAKPSTRVTTLGAAAQALAKARKMPASDLARRLRGDLDWIVMKALEKDRTRRYTTVQELAEDLSRYERDDPVSAGPPTARYLLRKALRRYRKQAIGAGVGVVALVVGLAVATWQYIEAERQRAVADHERREAQRQRADAEVQRTRAEQQEQVASDALARYEQLRDVEQLRQLEAEAASLVPIGSDMVEPLTEWNERAGSWLADMQDHEQTLDQLRERGDRRDGEYVFGDLADQFLFDALRELMAQVAEFRGPGGTLEQMKRRLRYAREVRKQTIEDYDTEWREATARVAANPDYRGLDLLPQEGLVPIGANAQGYEEFWMPLSGERPDRDLGRVIMDDQAGLVLVLLPGGEATVGSPPRDPTGRPYPPNELPRQQVELDPFLLSKYELTQGQWVRLTQRENPSKYPPPTVTYPNGLTGLSHPVETISWHEATDELHVVGLALPTEAQWEYACRSGRPTEWWFGDRSADGDRDVLLNDLGRCRFNAADGYVSRAEQAAYVPEAIVWPELDDGWVVHTFASNGSFDEPNGFGLYAMHGNIAEMTRGTIGFYPDHPNPKWGRGMSFAPGDGELLGGTNDKFAARGGSFYKNVEEARCSWRPFIDKTAKFDNIGVRAARRLDPR